MDEPENPPNCPKCQKPMRLMYVIPEAEGQPKIMTFKCSVCLDVITEVE